MRGCSVVEIKGRAERLTGEEAERLTSGRDTAMSEVERRGKGRGGLVLAIYMPGVVLDLGGCGYGGRERRARGTPCHLR
jgi:hypothetical protein